jgi:hypothetical protein
MRLEDTKIYDIYWDLIGWRTSNFISKIKNIVRWFPIIWNDRDYDNSYIMEILKFKLSNQANYISKKDRHTRAQYDAQKMRLCVRLIEKFQEEYYNLEYFDYFNMEVSFTECVDRPDCSEMNTTVTSEQFDEYIKKYPSVHRRVLKGEGWLSISKCDDDDIKYRIVRNIADINHQRAKKLLFKVLETHIESWWD